ncbi:hypothetical protein E4U55_005851 [Claviceps digitariae]|nr:hypothetical protein E4U55_005851 [Claviceps digitariae]
MVRYSTTARIQFHKNGLGRQFTAAENVDLTRRYHSGFHLHHPLGPTPSCSRLHLQGLRGSVLATRPSAHHSAKAFRPNAVTSPHQKYHISGAGPLSFTFPDCRPARKSYDTVATAHGTSTASASEAHQVSKESSKEVIGASQKKAENSHNLQAVGWIPNRLSQISPQ